MFFPGICGRPTHLGASDYFLIIRQGSTLPPPLEPTLGLPLPSAPASLSGGEGEGAGERGRVSSSSQLEPHPAKSCPAQLNLGCPWEFPRET